MPLTASRKEAVVWEQWEVSSRHLVHSIPVGRTSILTSDSDQSQLNSGQLMWYFLEFPLLLKFPTYRSSEILSLQFSNFRKHGVALNQANKDPASHPDLLCTTLITGRARYYDQINTQDIGITHING